ncbi:hypothetical protein [Arthrobacter rhizosphaerae]|uniref:hypothetical protein n=1 Tax=Arthrobacter rhizosphaerae TaxID=2855490 RepID=UPI001FF344EE|nr:hypothetical protein [Arthrobacter rhizosphaerae]
MSESGEDWRQLVGRVVELRRNGQLVRTAEVEDVTPDSSILWLRFDGNHGRQLVTRTDGYEVRPL